MLKQRKKLILGGLIKMAKTVKSSTEVTDVLGLEPHSVKLSMNSRGKMTGEVKVYANTPDKALSEACRLMRNLDVIIKENNLEKIDLGGE